MNTQLSLALGMLCGTSLTIILLWLFIAALLDRLNLVTTQRAELRAQIARDQIARDHPTP